MTVYQRVPGDAWCYLVGLYKVVMRIQRLLEHSLSGPNVAGGVGRATADWQDWVLLKGDTVMVRKTNGYDAWNRRPTQKRWWEPAKESVRRRWFVLHGVTRRSQSFDITFYVPKVLYSRLTRSIILCIPLPRRSLSDERKMPESADPDLHLRSASSAPKPLFSPQSLKTPIVVKE